MRLSALLDPGSKLIGDGNVEVTRLCLDSREVRPGDLFAALAGSRADGRRFIGDATARGAVAVMGDVALETAGVALPLVISPNPRRTLALMAARLVPAQPPVIAAVTGTNGKTSTASFLRQLWLHAGKRAASLGTLGVQSPVGDRKGALTTPDAVALHDTLAQLARDGVECLAIEASSHGLDQHRLDGVRLTAAAFTNLSRDHFDYHGSPEAYLAAKTRLFADLLPPGWPVVLNADVPEFAGLAALARSRGCPIIDYGRDADRLKLLGRAADGAGQAVEIAIDGKTYQLRTGIVGAFMVENMLAALGLFIATGGDVATGIAGLSGLVGAPGRMELVARTDIGAAVFVDYAHTPDGLEKALSGLREHVVGRLAVVFGCGGDRDAGKRPLMGGIAARLADRVIVTDDNPRTENAATIRVQVMAGCPDAEEIGDRAAAIHAGIVGLGRGDALLIAGKGHERGQIVGDRVLPFDDAGVARAAVGDGAAA